MTLNKKSKDKFHYSKCEIDNYLYYMDDWWYDAWDDENYDYNDDDYYEYEYSDNDQPIYYQRYIIRRLSVPSTDYRSSGLRPIDMESIYTKQEKRQRKIDQVLDLLPPEIKKPTFKDIFPSI